MAGASSEQHLLTARRSDHERLSAACPGLARGPECGIAYLDAEELIDTRIGVHDDNQFELKLDYGIDPSASRSSYRVEAYFFVPKALGIESHSYTRDQFYSDVQANIRFKTPSIPLESLTDPGNERSPLFRLAKIARSGRELRRRQVSREMRMLGCLARANVRDAVAAVGDLFDGFRDEVAERHVLVQDARTAMLQLLDGIHGLVDRFRGMRPDFMRPREDESVRELYTYADEHTSLAIESYLTVLITRIDGDPPLADALADVRQQLKDVVLAEQAHRQGAGYVSVLSGDHSTGAYVYRKSALKKFMSSVLFLEISKEQGGRPITHLLAGAAAGVAMLFSTVAAIWTQGVYGLNSFPFVIAIVVAYIFKDRIKEWLRTYFSSKMTGWLFDYSVIIRDPVNDIVVGRCRESFNYVPIKKLDRAIYRTRHADATSVLESESKPEVVMKYVKDVQINGRRVADVHGRLNDINDIIRFNVSNFLVRMDDPLREVATFDAAFDGVRSVPCPKLYHVNVVLVLRAKSRPASYERFRVILDKTGIRELQEVPVGNHAP